MAGEGRPPRRPNLKLRRQRRLRGWSIDELADELCRLAGRLGEPLPGVNGSMVSRWERGVRSPRPRYVRLLCKLFDLPADELGLVEPDHSHWHGHDGGYPDIDGDGPVAFEHGVRRRSFLRAFGVAGISMLFGSLGQLGSSVEASSPGGSAAVWEKLVAILAECWRTTSPQLLLPMVDYISGVLTSSPGGVFPFPAVERPRLRSELALLTGWIAFRMENRGDARACWRQALDLARGAGDRDLEAFTLVAQSSLYSGVSTGLACSWPAAMDLLNATDSLQPRSLAVRVRMLARRAEEHAVRGRERESREDLERAERLRAAPVACVDDRLGHWGSIRLDGYRGSCAILLGCGSEAVHLLEGALRGAPSAPDRSLLLADLGAAHAQAGAVDAASESLIESVSLAAEAHAFEFVQRAVGVRQRQLARWSHEPAVRQLDEVLAEAR